ncbi:MFS transporter [Sanguibacter antarcticus]|uniref:MFS transporter n=1 Tax=Sanguibacter antarcticus TaxID=372484 RepID=A0A2A9E8I1_9MICO|nr:MFS transporter [Sanguibacter antarcticus]PFG35258.1 MFS transporter [Sanguibacter antarcticus]
MTRQARLSATRPSGLPGLVGAHTLAVVGNVVTLVALPLYVLDETGSAVLTGVLAIATTLPIVLGGALGGVLVDRFGYRRSSIVSDLVGAATISAIPLLHATVGLPLWGLFALVFATGLLDAPGQGARTALVPEAAGRAGVPLDRAMGWWGAAQRSGAMIGAPLAGLLVAWLGPIVVLVLNGATFLVSALLVQRTVPVDLQAEDDPTGPGASGDAPDEAYWAALRAGLQAVWSARLLRAVVLMVLLTNALDVGLLNVALPVYAADELGGARAYGLLVGAFGLGALTGSLVYSAVGTRVSRRATYALGFALAGPPMCFALAARPGLVGCVAVMVVGGLAAGALNPIIGTLLLEQVPRRMRARVNGAVGAGAWAAMPVGALGAGVLVEEVGLVTALVVMGAAYTVIVVGPFVLPVWRGLERPRTVGTVDDHG